MRAALQKVALLLCSLLLALLVLEVAVRILVPRPTAPPVFDRSTAYYLPYSPHPRQGGRAAEDRLRRAVVGDSFTKGVGVQTYDRYAERLEWLLNLNHAKRPAEIRVFDKAGTSTYQQFPLLERALAWNPELVILGVVLNDTEDHTRPGEIERRRAGIYPVPRLPGSPIGEPGHSFTAAGRSASRARDSASTTAGSSTRTIPGGSGSPKPFPS